MNGNRVVGETSDARGVRVVLLGRIWRDKVLVEHPEMAPFMDEVLSAVGPSKWLLVVVSYAQEPARIISAFANRKDPPRWSA